jgi:hypothetical protein
MLKVKLTGASNPDMEPLVLPDSEARNLFKRLSLPLQADHTGDFSAFAVQKQCQQAIRDTLIPLEDLEAQVHHLLTLAEDEIATSSCQNGGETQYATIWAEPFIDRKS